MFIDERIKLQLALAIPTAIIENTILIVNALIVLLRDVGDNRTRHSSASQIKLSTAVTHHVKRSGESHRLYLVCEHRPVMTTTAYATVNQLQ